MQQEVLSLDDIIKAVLNTDLFRDVDPSALNTYFKSLDPVRKNYHKGSVIHFQNEKCNGIDLIIEGDVEIIRINEDGSYLTMSKLFARDSLGANAIFSTSGSYPFTAVAASNVEIINIPEKIIRDLCIEDSRFVFRLIRMISDRSDSFTGWISGISRKTIKQNIKDYLILLSETQMNDQVVLDCSKTELAAKFGVNRSSLGRIFTQLQREGSIEMEGRRIRLINLK